MKRRNVSQRVIRRISFYYEALLKLGLPGDEYISSQKLQEITGVSSNQVRQDFFHLDISIGRQKKGYPVRQLLDELKKVLSIDAHAAVIVVGAGRLGCALAEFDLFRVRHIAMAGLFDIDPDGVAQRLKQPGTIPVYHVDQLESFLATHPEARTAILAVPEDAAQTMLDRLVAAGVRAIVNYAPRILRVPPCDGPVTLVNDCIGSALYKVIFEMNHRGDAFLTPFEVQAR